MSGRSRSTSKGILDAYQGEKDGYVRHGFGSYSYNSFYHYSGFWEDNRKNGTGVFVLKDGTRFHGQFKNGEISGNGVKIWPDANQVYSGTFLKGHMHGHGEIKYSDGSTVRPAL